MPARSSSAKPTIVDVAARAGVSKGAVSLALNSRPGVSDETRARILVAAEDLGWAPNVTARSLSTDRAYALGLVIARDPGVLAADPFFPSFISGIESELAARGITLTLAMTPDVETELAAYRRLARGRRVDGVLITDLRVADERIPLVAELGLPAVTIGRADAASAFPAVTVDDGPGIRAAVAHLAGLGHVRIAHVAGPAAMLHGAHRRAEFEAAMREAGLEPGPVVVTDFSAADGARATGELLDASASPTAIVYANDPMAIAGIGVAHSRGLRVPRDLSITGFDGSEIGQHLFPALTSVGTEVRGWGAAATRVLLELIDHPAHAADVDLPPAALVIRDSTAPPPTDRDSAHH